MGWNRGYTIFEKTVIGAYNLGVLDKKLLGVLMKPYGGTDIDSGGSQDLKSKDGLSVEEVVIKTLAPAATFKKLKEKLAVISKHPKNYNRLTEEQQDAQSEYYDWRYEQFRKLTKRFGW